MKWAAPFIAACDWRTHEVLWRQARIYLRNWYTGFLPPACEPVLYLLVFGLGVGGIIGAITWRGEHLPYLAYIAPGLIAFSAFSAPFFQGMYGTFVRMHYQKTWEGQLGTQVELVHVITGEMLWCACMGATYAAIVSLVLGLFCALGILHLHWWLLPCCLPIALVLGCAMSLVGLLFTSFIPTIDHMNLPTFLIGFPVGFISDTYFPVVTHHAWLAALVALNPVHHCAEAMRALLVSGTVDDHAIWLVVECLIIVAVLFPIVVRLFRRRVLGE